MTRAALALTAFSLSAFLSACEPSCGIGANTEPPTLTEQWVLEGFDAPESVIAAGDGETLYVSNVGGEGGAKDGNGVISKITIDGTMIDRNWLNGTGAMPLHAPKGMALIGGTLAVTDIDHVVMIDVAAGQSTARIPIEGAAFLNDAAVGPDGSILVSDSGTASIHIIKDGIASLWLNDAQLDGVNGLQMDGGRLFVTTMSAGELLIINPETKAIDVIGAGMENADGIGQLSDGSFIISSWPGQLWHVNGLVQTLLQDTTGDTPILMNDILLSGDMLITPNWVPGTVRGYGVE
jgi:DNA-binding beta-propeller fold protein YncE